MKHYERSQKAILVERLREVPRRIVVVRGPRQTGKTTLVRQAIQEIQSERSCKYLEVDAIRGTCAANGATPAPTSDEDEQSKTYEAEPASQLLILHWESSRKQARDSRYGSVLVLDGIQHIPNWSAIVKGMWDHDRWNNLPLHVVLVESVPFTMQNGLTESMAGRFEVISVPHWSFKEVSEAFGLDINQFLFFGGYPGASLLIGDQELWSRYICQSIIEPSLERDALLLQRADSPGLLKKLFDLATKCSGHVFSFNKMRSRVQDRSSTTTFTHYLDLLSRAGLVSGLLNYSNSKVRSKSSGLKLVVRNTALKTARSDYSFEQAQADRTYWYRLVESAVGAHLLNTKHRHQQVYYWNFRSNKVDFVMKQASTIRAIEVNSGSSTFDRTGIEEFQNQFGGLEPIFIGESGVPLNEFLSRPASNLLEM